jgi:hypothetical protein
MGKVEVASGGEPKNPSQNRSTNNKRGRNLLCLQINLLNTNYEDSPSTATGGSTDINKKLKINSI